VSEADEIYCQKCGSCGIPDCCGFSCLYVQDHRDEFEQLREWSQLLYDMVADLRRTIAALPYPADASGEFKRWYGEAWGVMDRTRDFATPPIAAESLAEHVSDSNASNDEARES
jgi:hypothetical protein